MRFINFLNFYIDMVNLEVIAEYKAENLSFIARTKDEEVIIRPAVLDDALWIYENIHIDPEGCRKFIDHHQKDERSIMFVFESEKGPFGHATLYQISDEGTAEYNRVRREIQGYAKGGITAGIKEINKFCFEEVGLDNISLGMFTDNHRAKKLYYACGFITTGADIPMESNQQGTGWKINEDLGGKAEKYLTRMELTKERFEFLKSISQ